MKPPWPPPADCHQQGHLLSASHSMPPHCESLPRSSHTTSSRQCACEQDLEPTLRRGDAPSSPAWKPLPAISLVLRKAGSSDTTLASDATPALQLTGIIRPSGRGGPVPLPPGVTSDTVRTSLATLLETHAEERRRGFFRLPSTRGQEMLGILRTEATKGFWREHDLKEASGSMGDWCGWLFFPVNAADKVRGCLGGHQRVHLSTRVQLGPRH